MSCCKSKGNIIIPPILIMPHAPPMQRQVIPPSCPPNRIPYIIPVKNCGRASSHPYPMPGYGRRGGGGRRYPPPGPRSNSNRYGDSDDDDDDDDSDDSDYDE